MVGILLINLGTPDSPEVKDVRKYLREFLMDGRVIDAPYPIRAALVHLRIAPFRAPGSARAYQEIWMDEGSPLLVYSEALASALQESLGQDHQVVLAMRYGEPSLKAGLAALSGLDRIVIVPLYPHYASSSTGTALEKVYELVSSQLHVPALTVLPPFYEHPAYIAAMVEQVGAHLSPEDHLLFTYHSIPVRQIPCAGGVGISCAVEDACPVIGPENHACYRAHCFATSRAVAGALGHDRWSVSFQSKLGRAEWVRPSTESTLESLPDQGVRSLVVVSPSFVADNLETLEELGIRGREDFLNAGGEKFTLVPALNSSASWVNALKSMVREIL